MRKVFNDYMGCFIDDTIRDVAINGMTGYELSQLGIVDSKETCISYCRAYSTNYYALQNS